MKKYIIIALILIFGIAGLSGYCTYRKINSDLESNVETSVIKSNEDLSNDIKTNESVNMEADDKIKKSIASEAKQNTKIDNSNINKPNKDNNKKTIKQTETSEIKQGQVKQDTKSTINNSQSLKQEENKKEQTADKENKIIEEEWKVNQNKINEIITIINNNPSEDMLLYGYNVVVDSSIVELTNEFTFSEKRVKDKIKYKFGTIKIYVRDYYKNGQYVTTECYLI